MRRPGFQSKLTAAEMKGRSNRGRSGRSEDPGVSEVPDGEAAEEVVRLDAAAGAGGKISRSGSTGIAITPGTEARSPTTAEEAGDAMEGVDVEDVWEQRDRHSPMGLIVLAGILGLGLLGVGLLLIPKGDRLVDERAARLAAELQAEEQSMKDAGVLMEHIEVVVRKYLEADTVEEKLKYVRHRARVKPLMERHYRERPLVPRSYERVTAFYPVGVENESFLFMQVRGDDGELLPLLLEQVGQDEFLVDWESDVVYQPMPLAEFLEQRPAEAIDFRLFAKLDTFYAYEFVDVERYQCLMLTERNSDTFLFGYVERDTEEHRELMDILKGDAKRTEPILLKLRFLPGSPSKRSVLIEDVVARRWALMTAGDAEE